MRGRWSGLIFVIPIVFAILTGVFYNNKRFDDVNRRIDDLRMNTNQMFIEMLSEFKEEF